MDKLNSLKAQGVKKIQSKKFNDAILDFTTVINELSSPTNDEEANLKSTCLINRSSCSLMLVQQFSHNKSKEELESLVQKAIDDSNQSIEVLNKARNAENYFENLLVEKKKEKKKDEKKKDEEDNDEAEKEETNKDLLKKDPLTHLFALSNLRLGESYETLGDFRKAFNYYSKAFNAEQFDYKNPNVNNNIEAKKAIREFLLKRYDVPDIKPVGNNDIIKLFVEMRNTITEKSVMMLPLTTFLSKIYADQINAQTLKKLETLKYFNLIYAILHLYIDDPIMVLQTIAATRFICNKHFRSFYDHLFILYDVMNHEIRNPATLPECIKILALSPRDMQTSMISKGFIPLAFKCFGIGDKLKDADADYIFCFLFILSQSPSNVPLILEKYDIGLDEKAESTEKVESSEKVESTEKVESPEIPEDEDYPIVHLLLQRKGGGMYGLMLLGKLCMDKKVLFLAEKLGATDWVMSVLQGIVDVDIPNFVEGKRDVIFSTHTYLSRLLLSRSHEENQSAEAKNQEISRTVDLIVPILKKAPKNPEIVSYSFSYLAQAVEYVPAKIKESKVIVLASLTLSMHMDFRPATQNIVTFLYEAADHGNLVEEIKQCKPVIPTVLKAVHDHPKTQVLVERASALIYLCDHENKDALLNAALEQFPKDEFLEKFITDHIDLINKNKK